MQVGDGGRWTLPAEDGLAEAQLVDLTDECPKAHSRLAESPDTRSMVWSVTRSTDATKVDNSPMLRAFGGHVALTQARLAPIPSSSCGRRPQVLYDIDEIAGKRDGLRGGRRARPSGTHAVDLPLPRAAGYSSPSTAISVLTLTSAWATTRSTWLGIWGADQGERGGGYRVAQGRRCSRSGNRPARGHGPQQFDGDGGGPSVPLATVVTATPRAPSRSTRVRVLWRSSTISSLGTPSHAGDPRLLDQGEGGQDHVNQLLGRPAQGVGGRDAVVRLEQRRRR